MYGIKIGRRICAAAVAFFVFTAGVVSSGCGGDSFKPFADIPDANIEDEYYTDFIERYSRYVYIYSYFVMKNRAEKSSNVYNMESSEFDFYTQIYNEWSEQYPDKVAVMEENSPNLIKMLSITQSSMVSHFERMKETIDGYVKCVYLDDPRERDNYESYVSDTFYFKEPKERVSDYLTENNIHVMHIEFSEYFSSFLYHSYPFRIEYDFKIFYYTGDTEVPEKKWKTADLTVEYFLIRDKNNNYVIDYINDVSKYTEQFVEGEIMIEDVPTYEWENVTSDINSDS